MWHSKIRFQIILIQEFLLEKNPPGNIANGAVYVFEEDSLDWIIRNQRKCFLTF